MRSCGSLDYERSSDPGSRCLLSPGRSPLFVPDLVENQQDAGRSGDRVWDRPDHHIPLPARVESKLKRMLPTARYIMEKLDGMDNVDQIKKIFPGFDGTVIVDGTPRGGPAGRRTRMKERPHTAARKRPPRTTPGSTPRPTGGILGISDTKPGSTHDITELRESIEDMGVIGESMRDPDTPADERLELLGDGGYQGGCQGLPRGPTSPRPQKSPETAS